VLKVQGWKMLGMLVRKAVCFGKRMTCAPSVDGSVIVATNRKPFPLPCVARYREGSGTSWPPLFLRV